MYKRNKKGQFVKGSVPTFNKEHKEKISVAKTGKLRPDMEGENNIMWKGGKYVSTHGYQLTRIGINKYQRENRRIMEGLLGRRLEKNEQVHHKNGKKLDNRIENLEILNIKEHTRLHSIERWNRGINEIRHD